MSGRGRDTKPRKRRPSIPLADRVWAKVDKNGPTPMRRPELGPCWLWNGARGRAPGHEYGRVGNEGGRGGGTTPVHRVVYEMMVGPIPAGMYLDHLCRNPPCCNPAHLEPVTNAENIRRGYEAKGACRNGHAFSLDASSGRGAGGYKGWRVCRVCIQNGAKRLHPQKMLQQRLRRAAERDRLAP